MILDKRNEFADAVSVVGSAGTALIGNVIDLETPNRDIGAAEHLFFMVTVDTEIITAGSAGTIKFLLVSDSTSTIATDGSATVHYDSGTFATGAAGSNAKLKGGAIPVQIAIPLQGKEYERYLGVLAVIATQAVTAGAINAFLTPDKHVHKHYAEGEN